MGIINIPNQPIHFEVPIPETCDDFTQRCAQFAESDLFIYTQFKIEYCDIVPAGIVEYGDGWFQDGDKYCHTPEFNQPIVISASPSIEYYGNNIQFQFTLTNVFNGSISINFGTTTQTFSTNGTFNFYASWDGIQPFILVTPSLDFDGCFEFNFVKAIDIPLSSTEWLGVYSIDDEYIPLPATCLIATISQNYVTVKIDISCLDTKGCYYLKVCDPCGFSTEPAPSDNLLSNSDFSTNSDWAVIDDGGIQHISFGAVPAGLFCTIAANNVEQFDEFIQQPVTFSQDCCYRLTIEYGDILPSFQTNILNTLFEIVIADGTHFNIVHSIVSTQIVPSVFANGTFNYEWCWNDLNIDLKNYTNLIVSVRFAVIAPNTLEAGDYIEIKRIELNKIGACSSSINCSYLTNCFQILPFNQLQGTTLVRGKSKTNSFQLGFYWDGNFELRQRLKLLRFAPTYPIDGKDYIFSDGRQEITSAQRAKFYDVVFSGLTENQHDVLSTQILTKEFKIKDDLYFVRMEDYKPEWSKDAAYPYADVRLMAMKQGSIIFKSNEN